MPRHQMLILSVFLALSSMASCPTTAAVAPLLAGQETNNLEPHVSPTPGKTIPARSAFPLLFVPNQGQWVPEVAFQTQTAEANMFFTREEMVILARGAGVEPALVRMRPLNAEPGMRLVPGERTPTRLSYFRGNDLSQWRTDIPSHAAIRYQQIYTGIDLIVRGEGRRMAYDFVLAPGVDSTKVRLAIEGVKNLTLDTNGDMIMTLANGRDMRQHAPFIYQEQADTRVEVKGRFVILESNPQQSLHVFGFEIAQYDPTLSLVIDPTLEYSNFVGGTLDDDARALTVTKTGEVIVAGSTLSTDFPGTPSPYGTQTKRDALIYRINAAGNSLDYVVLLCGSLDEQVNAVALGADGSIYLTGQTTSDNFPKYNALYPVRPGALQAAFIAKLNADGDELLFSSYFGGTGIDAGLAIGVDDQSNTLYIGGTTTSLDMMVDHALYPTPPGGGDGFLIKMKDDGSTIDFSTYFGGSAADSISALAVLAAGNVYLAGNTASSNLPVQHAIQALNAGGTDTFVARIATIGPELVFSTYLGGSGTDSLNALAADQDGHLFLSGHTNSTNFPVKNALYAKPLGANDAFVSKLDRSGRFLHFTTYLGGSADDKALAATLDQAADSSDGLRYLYLGGSTQSNQFPTENADQPWYGGNQDGFLAKLDPRGLRLIYSSYFGGMLADSVTAMGTRQSKGTREVYITGNTTSTHATGLFPVAPDPPAIQPDNQGGVDTFVSHVEQMVSDTDAPFLRLEFVTVTPEKASDDADPDNPSDPDDDGFDVHLNLKLDTPKPISAFSTEVNYDIDELEYRGIKWSRGLSATTVTEVDIRFPGKLMLTVYQEAAPTPLPERIAKLMFKVRDVGQPTTPPPPSKQITLTQEQSWAADLRGRNTFIGGIAGGMLLERRCNNLIGDCDCSGLVRIWEVQSSVIMSLKPEAKQAICVKRNYVRMVPTDLTEVVNNYLDRITETASAKLAIHGSSIVNPSVKTKGSSTASRLHFSPATSRNGIISTDLVLNTDREPVSVVSTDIVYDPKAFSSIKAVIGPAAMAAAKNLVFKIVKPGLLRVVIYGINKTAIRNGVVGKIRLAPRIDLALHPQWLRHEPLASSPDAQDVPIRGNRLQLQ